MTTLRTRLLVLVAAVLVVAGVSAWLLLGQWQAARFEEFIAADTADRAHAYLPLVEDHHVLHGGWSGVEAVLDRIAQSSGRVPYLVEPDLAVRVAPAAGAQQVVARRLAEGGLELTSRVHEGEREWVGVLRYSGGAVVYADGVAVGELLLGPALAEAGVEHGPGGERPGLVPPAETHAIRYLGGMSRTAALALFVSALAALLLAAALSRRVLGPVAALTAAVRRLAAGDLDQRVEVRSRDEIGELAGAFNHMAGRLQEIERLRRELVADVAHELRTPLTNLRAQVEALQDGLRAADTAALASLHEEILHLATLLDDLRDLAAADAGQLRLERARLDLGEELGRAIAALAPLAREHALTLELSLPDALPAVHADARRLGQVARNLVTNALEHTPAGGRVTVTARPAAAGFVAIEVADTGPGIPAEQRAHVFERFWRADPSRARATGGVGLGLAIVRQLVEAMGGRVGVDDAPGGGARLTFTLPAG